MRRLCARARDQYGQFRYVHFLNQRLDPGGFGLALAPRIRLLKDMMASLSAERKSTGVIIRIVLRQNQYGQYPGRYAHDQIQESCWDQVVKETADADFRCKPEVQAACEPWNSLRDADLLANSNVRDVVRRLEAALGLNDRSE